MTTTGGRRIVPYDYDVVTRRVNQPSSLLRRVMPEMPRDIGLLRIDRPFTENGDDAIPSWHTTGRLYAQGLRLALYTRVDIELTGWSSHASELRVRPVTRRFLAWGKRRQRRYFRLAHRTGDEFVRAFDVAVRRHVAATVLARRTVPDRRSAPRRHLRAADRL